MLITDGVKRILENALPMHLISDVSFMLPDRRFGEVLKRGIQEKELQYSQSLTLGHNKNMLC